MQAVCRVGLLASLAACAPLFQAAGGGGSGGDEAEVADSPGDSEEDNPSPLPEGPSVAELLRRASQTPVSKPSAVVAGKLIYNQFYELPNYLSFALPNAPGALAPLAAVDPMLDRPLSVLSSGERLYVFAHDSAMLGSRVRLWYRDSESSWRLSELSWPGSYANFARCADCEDPVTTVYLKADDPDEAGTDQYWYRLRLPESAAPSAEKLSFLDLRICPSNSNTNCSSFGNLHAYQSPRNFTGISQSSYDLVDSQSRFLFLTPGSYWIEQGGQYFKGVLVFDRFRNRLVPDILEFRKVTYPCVRYEEVCGEESGCWNACVEQGPPEYASLTNTEWTRLNLRSADDSGRLTFNFYKNSSLQGMPTGGTLEARLNSLSTPGAWASYSSTGSVGPESERLADLALPKLANASSGSPCNFTSSVWSDQVNYETSVWRDGQSCTTVQTSTSSQDVVRIYRWSVMSKYYTEGSTGAVNPFRVVTSPSSSPVTQLSPDRSVLYFVGRTNLVGFEERTVYLEINMSDGSFRRPPMELESAVFSAAWALPLGSELHLFRATYNLRPLPFRLSVFDPVEARWAAHELPLSNSGVAMNHPLGVSAATSTKVSITGGFDSINGRAASQMAIYDLVSKDIKPLVKPALSNSFFWTRQLNYGRLAGGRESYKVRANGPAVVGSFLTIASSSLGVK